jgi:hypothetical protein
MRHPGNAAPMPNASIVKTIDRTGASLYTVTFTMHGSGKPLCTVNAQKPVGRALSITSIERSPLLDYDDPDITDDWIKEATLEYIEDSGF